MGKGERIGEGLLISTNTVPGIFISKKKKKKESRLEKSVTHAHVGSQC